MTTNLYQVEINFKPDQTPEEKSAVAEYVQALLKAVEEAEGTDEQIPACIDALTIRRI